MDGVATGGQFLPEFRTDDAAAAVGWIDRDADVHKDRGQTSDVSRDNAISYRQMSEHRHSNIRYLTSDI